MTSHHLVLILTLLIHNIDQSITGQQHPGRTESGISRSESAGRRHSESPLYPSQALARALEFGTKEAKELFETIEPSLYAQNIFIPADHPALFLAGSHHQTQLAKNLSRIAYASLRATLSFNEQLSQFRNDAVQEENGGTRISLTNSSTLKAKCPNEITTPECNVISRIYRSANGTCNNLKRPNWGSSFQAYVRFLPSEYDDDVSAIRKSVTGNELPSPRKISTSVHREASKVSAVHTLMVMQWGQFLGNDLTMSAQTRAFNNSVPKCCGITATQLHPDCLPIGVPPGDPYYNVTDCLEFIRSSPSPRKDCGMGPREQLNQVTSWLDGSVVYGSTDDEQRELRLFRGGKLKYHAVSNGKALLPRLQHPELGECRLTSPRLFCFRAGDKRVNQHPGLATMHTIWLRQHNFVAQKLGFMNPQWSEETIFQEARKIVITQLQHITFREFLPLVLGPNAVKTFGLRALRTGYFDGYDGNVDGTLPNAFGSAAFRFGHSLVESNLPRWDDLLKELPYRVNISLELMTPTNLHNAGEIDRITLGLASKRSQEPNEFITAELTNHLFKSNGYPGLDLAAINIQRGRDHGLAPYLKWREACTLLKPLKRNGPIVTWSDFQEATGLNWTKVGILAGIYESPWDVDLYPGGMLELPVRGGLVGATFACIIGQTFRNIRRGDRFWYENPGHFTRSQLESIRNVTLARVLCDTSDSITYIQPVVFLAPQLQRNPQASCSDSDAIPLMDFRPWNQVYASETMYWQAKDISSTPPVVENPTPSLYSLTNYNLALESPGEGTSAEETIGSSDEASYNLNFTRRSS